MENDKLVDCFVAKINKGCRVPIWSKDSPDSVRIGEPFDDGSYSDWHIKPYSRIDWVESL